MQEASACFNALLDSEPTPATPQDYIADLLELLAAVRVNKIRGKTVSPLSSHC